jgi:hypothetical protein
MRNIALFAVLVLCMFATGCSTICSKYYPPAPQHPVDVVTKEVYPQIPMVADTTFDKCQKPINPYAYFDGLLTDKTAAKIPRDQLMKFAVESYTTAYLCWQVKEEASSTQKSILKIYQSDPSNGNK